MGCGGGGGSKELIGVGWGLLTKKASRVVVAADSQDIYDTWHARPINHNRAYVT